MRVADVRETWNESAFVPVTAYYNEIDAYAAQWLRNLIAAGHIAPGEVDERDIRDVQPDDLRGYSQCHFFAGIGGWSYALRLAGWPNDRPVWTGSCPCQPFSAAGKGTGGKDERHLWPHWFRLIRECRPDIIFGENVAAAIGWGWIDAVLGDLEAEDYATGTAVLGAHSIGAPHIRQRVFFLAHIDSARPTHNRRIKIAETLDNERPTISMAGRTSRRHNDWAPEPDVVRVVDGLSRSMAKVCSEQIRCYGNAIVPQVAAEFIMAAS